MQSLFIYLAKYWCIVYTGQTTHKFYTLALQIIHHCKTEDDVKA